MIFLQKKVESYEYDSLGNLKRHGDKVKNSLTYTGREFDKETGLYYYRARYYDQNIGRFLQKDPLGYTADTNLYSYCDNNSVNAIDPLGLYTLIIHGRGGPYDEGYSGDIGKSLKASGEIVKEVIWSGKIRDLGAFEQIRTEIQQAAEIAKSKGEPLNIISHSWGGVLAGSALRATGVRANWVTLGTPYFNFTRPSGVVKYANFIDDTDSIALSSLFNLTAKQIFVINQGKGLFATHNYWNNPEVINQILKMFSLNKGKKK